MLESGVGEGVFFCYCGGGNGAEEVQDRADDAGAVFACCAVDYTGRRGGLSEMGEDGSVCSRAIRHDICVCFYESLYT